MPILQMGKLTQKSNTLPGITRPRSQAGCSPCLCSESRPHEASECVEAPDLGWEGVKRQEPLGHHTVLHYVIRVCLQCSRG